MAIQYRFPCFAALIVTVATRAGATILLSANMQDGLEIARWRVVDLFAAATAALLADYFGSDV